MRYSTAHLYSRIVGAIGLFSPGTAILHYQVVVWRFLRHLHTTLCIIPTTQFFLRALWVELRFPPRIGHSVHTRLWFAYLYTPQRVGLHIFPNHRVSVCENPYRTVFFYQLYLYSRKTVSPNHECAPAVSHSIGIAPAY